MIGPITVMERRGRPGYGFVFSEAEDHHGITIKTPEGHEFTVDLAQLDLAIRQFRQMSLQSPLPHHWLELSAECATGNHDACKWLDDEQGHVGVRVCPCECRHAGQEEREQVRTALLARLREQGASPSISQEDG